MKSLTVLILAFAIVFNFQIQGDPPRPLDETQSPPCAIVIFGATGDLTARKLLPALYNLSIEKNLSPQTAVIGFSRSGYSHDAFRQKMEKAVHQHSRTKSCDVHFWNDFKNQIFYNPSGFEDDEGYANLKQLLLDTDKELGTQGNRIYYLATPPSHFSTIIKKLCEHGLIYNHANNPEEKWSRVIIEKPFGKDLDSAILLKKEISACLDESQVYLMDHYLGKEGVQNLLALRFENTVFEPLWNNKSIDHVQITLSEEIGIGSRGNFWEETGSLRDVFQNHLMQLLAIVAMEPPPSLDAAAIRQEKIKVLNAIRPFSLNEEIDENVIRAQYTPGKIKKMDVQGYTQENEVSKNSNTETFVAAKLLINNSRWKGVPFYLRAGKRLAKQTTEIVIAFKNLCNSLESPNALFIRIQPDACIVFRILSKVPKLNKTLEPVFFGYNSEEYFKTTSPEAYEKLFFDCVKGDQSLYVNAEEQLASWRLLTPILNYWKSHPQKLEDYEAGSWGPFKAGDLLKKNGHRWQLLENL